MLVAGIAALAMVQVGGRPFRMGFTPWPSELSVAGIQQTERFWRQNGDLVSIMLIGGIPWQEALDGTPFSESVRKQLSYRPPQGHRLFLSISPLAMDRRSLTPNWGERDNMPLPPEWSSRGFDDPKVVRSFTNFVLRATEAMDPAFLAIGVESNALLSLNPAAWDGYKRLHRSCYLAVKKAYPRLPVFFTIEANHYLQRMRESEGAAQEREVKDLMRHSDMAAISYYPHMTHRTPWPIRPGFLSFARAFNKPIAVSETGMLSKPVTVGGIVLRGSEEDQKQYYETLLGEAERDRYRFIVTFCTTDYEKLLPSLPKNAADVASIWVYTGLQTSSGRLKPAGEVWKSYFRRRLEER